MLRPRTLLQVIFRYMSRTQVPGAAVVWCQEEPKNMGAWNYVRLVPHTLPLHTHLFAEPNSADNIPDLVLVQASYGHCHEGNGRQRQSQSPAPVLCWETSRGQPRWGNCCLTAWASCVACKMVLCACKMVFFCLHHVWATSYPPRWVPGQQTADAVLLCPTSTQELRLDMHPVKEPRLAEASLLERCCSACASKPSRYCNLQQCLVLTAHC